MNGFDHAAGKLNEEQVNFLVEQIRHVLNPTDKDLLLEAGCGAGMLISGLSTCVRRIVGVDYAVNMIKRCKKIFPLVELAVAEVRSLPFKENTFDKIVCFSVFQYFPNLKYAEDVLTEFFRVCKPGGRVFIDDIPDEEKKLECLEYRRKVSQKLEWRSSIKEDLQHQWYKKDFFNFYLSKMEIRPNISQQDIPGYRNSPYRFNVVFEK